MQIEPSLASDSNGIKKSLFEGGNFWGILGFIPEIFEIFLILGEICIELLMLVWLKLADKVCWGIKQTQIWKLRQKIKQSRRQYQS